jgi:predicted adenylyl cyclase CyaB
MKKIEVEVRGLLTKEKYDLINSFLQENGQFVVKNDRFMVIFSDMTVLNSGTDKADDIRIRITNGCPEIIIKKGKWGATEAREEISVKVQKGEFVNLVKTMAALGYKNGMLAERKSIIYKYRDVEFSLVEVPGHSWYFEGEIMVENEELLEESKKKIMNVCNSLDLEIFSDDDFYDYVDRLDKEANTNYDFERDGVKVFEKFLNI